MWARLSAWLAADPTPAVGDFWNLIDLNRSRTFFIEDAWPRAAPLYPFAFENDFASGGAWTMFARNHQPLIPVTCCVIYVLVVFGLQRYMRGRAAFEIRRAQVAWNLLLAAFSWCGALRMVPYLAALISKHGFFASYCGSPLYFGANGASALWTGLFCFSKVPELGDTLFIVLMKRKLLFLHWYHHVTVLLYTWSSYGGRNGAGIWFITMNFSVHAVMYLYFALMGIASLQKSAALAEHAPGSRSRADALNRVEALKRKLALGAPVITIMQISQMVVGIVLLVLINARSAAMQGDEECFVSRSSFVYGIVMYSSYFVLFALFALDRYVCRRPRSSELAAGKLMENAQEGETGNKKKTKKKTSVKAPKENMLGKRSPSRGRKKGKKTTSAGAAARGGKYTRTTTLVAGLRGHDDSPVVLRPRARRSTRVSSRRR